MLIFVNKLGILRNKIMLASHSIKKKNVDLKTKLTSQYEIINIEWTIQLFRNT